VHYILDTDTRSLQEIGWCSKCFYLHGDKPCNPKDLEILEKALSKAVARISELIDQDAIAYLRDNNYYDKQ
jgi:hypothetical protein